MIGGTHDNKTCREDERVVGCDHAEFGDARE